MRGKYDRRIHDKRLLDEVRRADFAPVEFTSKAYLDEPISIGHAQASLIASMVQALRLNGTEKVLEVDTGFGFQAAILSRLCREVFSIDGLADLAAAAGSNLKKAGIQNVTVVGGDGSPGLPDHAPFDRVIVSAAAPEVPQPLIDQLKDSGRRVQPIDPGGAETVMGFQKIQGALVEKEVITGACFVPLLGAFGARMAGQATANA